MAAGYGVALLAGLIVTGIEVVFVKNKWAERNIAIYSGIGAALFAIASGLSNLFLAFSKEVDD